MGSAEATAGSAAAKENGERQMRFMLAALEAASGTLRAYDVKAQIGMVAFAVVTNTIVHFADPQRLWQRSPELAAALVLLFLLTLIAHLSILFPRIMSEGPRDSTSGKSAPGLLFIRTADYPTPLTYLERLRAADLDAELAQQLVNLGKIRETKHMRTIQAIVLSGLFYAGVALAAVMH